MRPEETLVGRTLPVFLIGLVAASVIILAVGPGSTSMMIP
jgi:hypothetical protein